MSDSVSFFSQFVEKDGFNAVDEARDAEEACRLEARLLRELTAVAFLSDWKCYSNRLLSDGVAKLVSIAEEDDQAVINRQARLAVVHTVLDTILDARTKRVLLALEAGSISQADVARVLKFSPDRVSRERQRLHRLIKRRWAITP